MNSFPASFAIHWPIFFRTTVPSPAPQAQDGWMADSSHQMNTEEPVAVLARDAAEGLEPDWHIRKNRPGSDEEIIAGIPKRDIQLKESICLREGCYEWKVLLKKTQILKRDILIPAGAELRMVTDFMHLKAGNQTGTLDAVFISSGLSVDWKGLSFSEIIFNQESGLPKFGRLSRRQSIGEFNLQAGASITFDTKGEIDSFR